LRHVGEREAVEMRARIEGVHHHDLDHAAVAYAHGTRGKRVRIERHERERRHRRMQDRALRRERIGGGAGGRGDDDAVGAQRVDELAVDRELELDQAALRTLADHRLVERDGAQRRLAVPLDFAVEHRALLDRVVAVEDRAEAGLGVVLADVGHEAEAPEVDADQRHVPAHQLARRGEHRAVAADHDREVGLGVAFGDDFAAALAQKFTQLLEERFDLGVAQLPDEKDPAKRSRHARECTMNFMLDKRAQILLKTLIERYIAEGQPIGSRTLSKYSGLDLSPATIRNVMADLEELGFIASPHTSAGRVPTPLGYRFFVDTLLVTKPLESEAVQRMEGELHPDNPARVIQSASHLLSQLTQFAGVVMTPRRRALAFRHIEFLKLSEKRVLLIVVTPDGDVQNRILFTEREFAPGELVEAANFMNQNYAGQSFEDVRQRLHGELREIKQDMIRLLSAALEASNKAMVEGSEQYVISGERNLLSVQELSQDVARLKQL